MMRLLVQQFKQVGLRATNFATPNAKINVGIITTLIVPPNVNTGDSWAGISTVYIGVGIVTTLIVPGGGWIGVQMVIR